GRVAGATTLQDISRQGRVLIAHERIRMGTVAAPPSETKGKELTWLDGSLVFDISADGQTVLLSEQAAGASVDYGVYIRKIDGSDAVHLGEGLAMGLSPDGKWVLTVFRDQLVLLPTGAGEANPLPKAFSSYIWAM